MARNTKLTAEEIFAAEQAADNHRRTRLSGYALMEVRDRGEVIISDHAGKRNVAMYWPVNRELSPGETRFDMPNGKFMLEFKNKNGSTERVVFDAEEFRKWLRWA